MPNRQSDMMIDERTIQNRRRYFEFEASEMAPISGWVMRPGGKGVRGHQRAFIGQKGQDGGDTPLMGPASQTIPVPSAERPRAWLRKARQRVSQLNELAGRRQDSQ